MKKTFIAFLEYNYKKLKKNLSQKFEFEENGFYLAWVFIFLEIVSMFLPIKDWKIQGYFVFGFMGLAVLCFFAWLIAIQYSFWKKYEHPQINFPENTKQLEEEVGFDTVRYLKGHEERIKALESLSMLRLAIYTLFISIGVAIGVTVAILLIQKMLK